MRAWWKMVLDTIPVVEVVYVLQQHLQGIFLAFTKRLNNSGAGKVASTAKKESVTKKIKGITKPLMQILDITLWTHQCMPILL